jgi:hypothetical protein
MTGKEDYDERKVKLKAQGRLGRILRFAPEDARG